MKKRLCRCFAFGAWLASAVAVSAATEWMPIDWQGERALVNRNDRWAAVVSLERARLVYLGKADLERNILFATATRDDPAGWGGHRLWLGPQSAWNPGWPPPAGWDAQAAVAVRAIGARLELDLAGAGGGWPGLMRVYEWRGSRLHCGAAIRGGSRPAQIIHILQVPPHAEARLRIVRGAETPRGYVQVHMGRPGSPVRKFERPPQVAEIGDQVALRFNGVIEKLGFERQPISAAIADLRLMVSAAEPAGRSEGVPDGGFVTQVYLGNASSPFIELEQLSPLFVAGEPASFEMVLEPSEAKAE